MDGAAARSRSADPVQVLAARAGKPLREPAVPIAGLARLAALDGRPEVALESERLRSGRGLRALLLLRVGDPARDDRGDAPRGARTAAEPARQHAGPPRCADRTCAARGDPTCHCWSAGAVPVAQPRARRIRRAAALLDPRERSGRSSASEGGLLRGPGPDPRARRRARVPRLLRVGLVHARAESMAWSARTIRWSEC